jgi:hypothetical protein
MLIWDIAIPIFNPNRKKMIRLLYLQERTHIFFQAELEFLTYDYLWE